MTSFVMDYALYLLITGLLMGFIVSWLIPTPSGKKCNCNHANCGKEPVIEQEDK
jgi:hypothetical protein